MPSLFLLAQDAAAPAGAAPELPFFMNPLVLIGLMAAFYLLVILPASRRQKRDAAQMLASIKNGAKIVTTGGILGTVVKVKDGEDELTIRSDDTKFRILRSSVARVIADDVVTTTSSETKTA